MGYVAIKGGEIAIREAARVMAYLRTRGGGAPLAVETIRDQLHFLTGRVISEGGLYDPDLAALALKQAAGDTMEAAFFLRAYRSTRARLSVTEAHDSEGMRLIRRVSSAFKEIPGGQMLGPTSDYLQRLFRFEHLDESGEAFRAVSRDWLSGLHDQPDADLPDTFPKVLDALRAEGLLECPPADSGEAFDITRDYVMQREVFGQRLSDIQNTQFRMAELDAEIDMLQVFVDHCVTLQNKGQLTANLAAKAKMLGSEIEWKTVDQCLQLHGGNGYMKEYEISRLFTDARMSRIYAGSSEIMRYIIGRDVFSQKYRSVLE